MSHRLLGPLVADFGDHNGDLAIILHKFDVDDPTRLFLPAVAFFAPQTSRPFTVVR